MNRRHAFLILLALGLAALAPLGLAQRHARAAVVLASTANVDTPDMLRSFGDAPVAWTRLGRRFGDVRIVAPRDARPRGAIVLCHGMHRLGNEEPRLVAMATALAAAGYRVYLPRLGALTRYRLDPALVHELIAYARIAARREGRDGIPVVGISFAGGIALRAASEADGAISGVFALGAHHDLARSARWLVGEEAIGPSGRAIEVTPHPYGRLLLALPNPGAFFPEAPESVARAALLATLREEHDDARRLRAALPPIAQDRFRRLLRGELSDTERDLLRANIDENADALARLSPADHLEDLTVPAALLHGSRDPIIPATETLRASRELGMDRLAIVTPMLRHAEAAEGIEIGGLVPIVRLLAEVLSWAEAG